MSPEISPDNIEPMPSRSAYRGAFQALILHYLEWNRLVAQNASEEDKQIWQSKLGQLQAEHENALEAYIDARARTIIREHLEH